MNTDKTTTVAGLVVGAIVAANVNYAAALEGNTAEIGKIIGAIVIGLWGWLTNKK